jgi:hypothetical protein
MTDVGIWSREKLGTRRRRDRSEKEEARIGSRIRETNKASCAFTSLLTSPHLNYYEQFQPTAPFRPQHFPITVSYNSMLTHHLAHQIKSNQMKIKSIIIIIGPSDAKIRLRASASRTLSLPWSFWNKVGERKGDWMAGPELRRRSCWLEACDLHAL